MEKMAQTVWPEIEALKTDAEKIAMMQGVEDAAAMEDAGAFEEGANPEAGLPVETATSPLSKLPSFWPPWWKPKKSTSRRLPG